MKLQKKETHFAHFPRPGENDPYGRTHFFLLSYGSEHYFISFIWPCALFISFIWQCALYYIFHMAVRNILYFFHVVVHTFYFFHMAVSTIFTIYFISYSQSLVFVQWLLIRQRGCCKVYDFKGDGKYKGCPITEI